MWPSSCLWEAWEGAKKHSGVFLLAMVCMWAGVMTNALAKTTDMYPFDAPEKKVIFQEITSQLRCLVCQNQSIADSTAPLARDLRQVVYEQIQEGEDKAAVMAYITQRYGHYVQYAPPFNGSTALLWWGPFLFIAGIVGIVLMAQKKR